jgi:PAS domain S-box-containing protein
MTVKPNISETEFDLVVDLSGHIISAGDNLVAAIADKQTLIGQPLSSIFASSDTGITVEWLEEASKGSAIHSPKARIKTSSGQTVVQLHIKTLVSQAGKLYLVTLRPLDGNHLFITGQLINEAFVNASYDGYWDWYIQDDYEYMSPRFWDILGFRPEEKKHHPSEWQALIFEEDLPHTLENFDKHIATKGKHPFNQEVRYRHKDGSTVYIICRGQVVEWSEAGEPLRMIGAHTDITSLKETEEALKKAEERFDVAVYGSSFGLWDWLIPTGEEYWSPRFMEILGITDPEFVPTYDEFLKRLHPEDYDRVIEELNIDHFENDQPYELDYRLKHHSGHYVWVHARGQMKRDENGKPYRMAGTIQDITDRKKKDIALQDALAFQNLIMDSIPDGVFVKDKDFKIRSANPAFMSFYPSEMQDKVIGYTTLEQYEQDEAEEFLKEDRQAFIEGSSDKIETINFPDGELRTLSTKKIRFTNSEGDDFILAISRDVTERETLIAQLRRSNEELDEFAYIASHDLKEPLRGIHNHSELLRRALGDEIADDTLRRINRIGELTSHMDQLISDLFHFSGVGRSDLSTVETNIQELISDLTKSIPALEEESVKIVLDNPLPIVVCDKVRIREVFRNLISNAIKYNDAGEKVVAVGSYDAKLDGKMSTVFYVSDNGIGIDEEFHDEIFHIFRRLHKKDAYGGGTGAGLTLVRKIIERHGGKAWVTSKRGAGAVFHFSIVRQH